MGADIDWKSIIYRRVESDELDYKAAQNWLQLPRSGKAKFVRHCLAMANTKGGYVVVGVGEDASGQPAVFTGLTPEEAQSFDPTAVGSFINRYADPQIDFTLERPVVDGKRYVVFVIRRFSSLPHVCSAGSEHELLQGVFYIRTADASSRPAYRSSEIHGIIQRAMRNQREQLGRMIRGLLYETHNAVTPAEEGQSHFAEETAHSHNFFMKRRKNISGPSFTIELTVTPDEYVSERFTLSELRHQAEAAYDFHPNSAFIAPGDLREAYVTNVSLRFASEARVWQIYQSGLFHFIAAYPLKGSVEYRFLLDFFADAMQFLSGLYAGLGFDEQSLQIALALNHVENLELGIEGTAPDRYLCRIPEITISQTRTAADLASGYISHAAGLLRSVCERFNLPEGCHRNAPQMMKKHLNLL